MHLDARKKKMGVVNCNIFCIIELNCCKRCGCFDQTIDIFFYRRGYKLYSLDYHGFLFFPASMFNLIIHGERAARTKKKKKVESPHQPEDVHYKKGTSFSLFSFIHVRCLRSFTFLTLCFFFVFFMSFLASAPFFFASFFVFFFSSFGRLFASLAAAAFWS